MRTLAQAFSALGKPLPTSDGICIYRSGFVDSFELMQLVLEIELIGGRRIDLEALMTEDITMSRLRYFAGEA
jgi:hypothetical protein